MGSCALAGSCHGRFALFLPRPYLLLICLPADYAVFASTDFDPNDYANAILAGEPYPLQPGAKPAPRSPFILAKVTTQDSIAKEDISVAISKLTFGIDDVSKQIKNLVHPSRLPALPPFVLMNDR